MPVHNTFGRPEILGPPSSFALYLSHAQSHVLEQMVHVLVENQTFL